MPDGGMLCRSANILEEEDRMTTSPEESQIPDTGPLSSLTEDQSFYGEVQYLDYGGALSNKGCVSCREPCFLSIFVVFGPPPMG